MDMASRRYHQLQMRGCIWMDPMTEPIVRPAFWTPTEGVHTKQSHSNPHLLHHRATVLPHHRATVLSHYRATVHPHHRAMVLPQQRATVHPHHRVPIFLSQPASTYSENMHVQEHREPNITGLFTALSLFFFLLSLICRIFLE